MQLDMSRPFRCFIQQLDAQSGDVFNCVFFSFARTFIMNGHVTPLLSVECFHHILCTKNTVFVFTVVCELNVRPRKIISTLLGDHHMRNRKNMNSVCDGFVYTSV